MLPFGRILRCYLLFRTLLGVIQYYAGIVVEVAEYISAFTLKNATIRESNRCIYNGQQNKSQYVNCSKQFVMGWRNIFPGIIMRIIVSHIWKASCVIFYIGLAQFEHIVVSRYQSGISPDKLKARIDRILYYRKEHPYLEISLSAFITNDTIDDYVARNKWGPKASMICTGICSDCTREGDHPKICVNLRSGVE